MNAGNDLNLNPITAGEQRINAVLAAAQGAALLDKRDPNWMDKITDPIVSEVDEHELSLMEQLQLVPSGSNAVHERIAAVLEFVKAAEGEGPLFETAYDSHEDAMDDAFANFLEGAMIPYQEMLEADGPTIDLAALGLVTEFNTIGLGEHGGYTPTAEENARPGFCIEKAGEYLAEAWNDEINARKEGR